MKDQVRQIIGKTIKAVIITEGNDGYPKSQVFLIFDDEMYYEFYGDIKVAGGVDRGGSEAVLKYLGTRSAGLTSYSL